MIDKLINDMIVYFNLIIISAHYGPKLWAQKVDHFISKTKNLTFLKIVATLLSHLGAQEPPFKVALGQTWHKLKNSRMRAFILKSSFHYANIKYT